MSSSAWEIYQQQISKRLDDPNRNACLIPTGIPALDSLVQGGFEPGEFVALAGSTGSGKSMFAVNLAVEFAKRRKRVLIVNLEMKAMAYVCRILGSVTDVKTATWRGREGEPTAKERLELIQHRLLLEHLYVAEPYELRSIRDLQEELDQHNYDVILVDYVQLITTSSKMAKHEELTEIAGALKNAALDHNLVTLAVAQFKQEYATVEHQRPPSRTDIKDSYGIMHYADLAMGLFNVTQTPHEFDLQKLALIKQREGDSGVILEMRRFAEYSKYQSTGKVLSYADFFSSQKRATRA